MFTGVVEELGTFIKSVNDRFVFSARSGYCEEFDIGGSISVNGTCLTLVDFNDKKTQFSADVSEETRKKTNIGKLQPGEKVNLESPLEASGLAGKLDGHIVQGHVDTLGRIGRITRKKGDHILRISTSRSFNKYLVDKGSVAVDGISLTSYKVAGGSFTVTIVPHTYNNTTLQFKRSGSEVNVEFDVLAKYVNKNIRES